MASHNGAAFLPQTLSALRGQTRLIDRFIGVDASSSDSSQELLREHLPSDATILQTPQHSFGHSVMTAVKALGAPRAGRTEWLWLIHDDSVPELNALEKLVTVVEATESVTIAGCKQLDLDSPRRLLDVGLGVNKYAERLTLMEIDEVDQGQYDARTDTFAITSAGMLIRRDVFEALGGFDPALPGLGDDMDLCWRNRLMGNRVVIVPAAKIYHKAAVVRAVAGPAETRRAEVFMRLKHANAWAIPFLVIGAVLGGIYRFFTSLLAKDPGYAFGQLGATLRAVGTPLKLSRSRAAAATTRKVPRNSIARLLTDQGEVREHRKHMIDSLDGDIVYGDGTGATQTQDPSGDARNDFAALAAPNRTSAFVSAIIAVLATLAASLVGLRALLGAEAVAGGALLPISTTASAIYSNATSWWANLGAGNPSGGDPIDFLYWLSAALSGGNANGVAVVLTLLAMPLAALSAWISLGAVTRSRAVRMVGALLWALAPVLQVSLASGRAGGVLVHVLAPLLLLALVRSVGAGVEFDSRRGVSRPGAGSVPSWTAAAAASLLLVGVAAGSPAVGLALVVLIIVAAVVLRSRAKTLCWVPLPMLMFHLPLLIAALRNPRVLLTDPGLPLAFDPAPLWAQGLGFPTVFDPMGTPAGFGFLPDGPWALVLVVLIGAPLVAFAALGLFAGGDKASLPLARTLWLGAVLMLAAGYGASLIPASVAGSTFVSAFNGPFISFFVLGLIFAAGLGISVFRGERPLPASASVHAAPRRSKGVLVWASTLLGLSVLLAGANWVMTQIPVSADASATTELGTTSMLAAVGERTLPATAADRGLGAYEDRTLVLAQNGEGAVTAALMNGVGTTADALSQTLNANRLVGGLLEPTLRESDDADKLIEQTVAKLVSDSELDPRGELASLGTGFVVLQDNRQTASALVARLDAVPGLVPVGQTESGWLWRVEPVEAIAGADSSTDSTARVRVVKDGQTISLLSSQRGTVSGESIEQGDEGRLLVMAERSNPGWSATLNGEPLARVAVGAEDSATGAEGTPWAQGFELGTAGGTLELSYQSPFQVPVAIARIVVLLLALLLVIPVPRRRRFAARRLDEFRTRGNAESIDELDRGHRATKGKE